MIRCKRCQCVGVSLHLKKKVFFHGLYHIETKVVDRTRPHVPRVG